MPNSLKYKYTAKMHIPRISDRFYHLSHHRRRRSAIRHVPLKNQQTPQYRSRHREPVKLTIAKKATKPTRYRHATNHSSLQFQNSRNAMSHARCQERA